MLKKPITRFNIKVRSRHPSHDVLREELPRLPFPSVVRLGSTTPLNGKHTECNTAAAITNSSNKWLMKKCFTGSGVKTADWVNGNNKDLINWCKDKYPIVAKNHFGSRGNGNTLLNTEAEMNKWIQGKNLSNYIFEKFHNYTREYRLHVTKEGCFYTCRKMLKQNTPDKDKWFRNDKNCVWIKEENPLFNKPKNWNLIVSNCVNALTAVGLDIGACDVKVQSDKKGNECDFIIIEINSAPSFGDVTKDKYLTEIPKVLKRKHG